MSVSWLVWVLGVGCDLVGQECNLMYAPGMLTLELTQVPLGEAGAYTFQVEGSDGEVISCVLASEGETEGVCDGDGGSSLVRDGSTVTLSLWEFAADSVELTLLRDGVEQGAWSIVPTYTEDEPNGEGCGFRRLGTASVDLSL